MFKEKVAISVVGTGRMGYLHARLLKKLGYLDSVIDSNAVLAEKVGHQFKVPWFTNIEEMVNRNSPNGIIVAVPTKKHIEVVQNVIKNKLDVRTLLIEKPIASSIEEAEEVKSILARNNISVIIGHIEVYNPVVARIIQILSEKFLGEIRSIFFQRRGAVGEKRIQTLGDVYEDVGVHDFDVASRLLPKCEVKLYASAVKENGIDNSSVIVISSMNEEFYCTFLMSREYAGKARTIDIEGTRTTLKANLISQIIELRSLEVARGDKNISAIRIPFSSGEQMKVYGEPLLLELWNFVECVKGESVPLVSVDDGISALKLVKAARESIQSRKSVKLNL